MKNIISITIAIFFLLFNFACEDHLYIQLEDGMDGKDGRNGYSTVSRTQTVTGGTLVEFYLDTDTSFTYTPTDLFQNGFTVWDGEDGMAGTDGANANIKTSVIQDGDCGGPALLVETFSDGVLTSSQTICFPKDGIDGQDGQDGENGYNPVQLIESWEQDGRTGRKVTYYLDKNRNGIVDAGDELMGGYVNLDGQDGEDGIDGQDGADGVDGQDGKDAPIVTATFNITESLDCESGKSLLFSTFTDGVLTSSASVCIPRDGIDGQDGEDGIDGIDGEDGIDGANGLTPSIKAVRYNELPGAVDGSGMIIYWYLDLNTNGNYDNGDKLLSHSYLKDGEKGESGDDGMSVSLQVYNYQGDSSKVHVFYYDLNHTGSFEQQNDSIIDTYIVQLIPPSGKDDEEFRSSNYAIFYDFNTGNNSDFTRQGGELKYFSTSNGRIHGFYNGAKEGYIIFPKIPPVDNAYRFEFMYAVNAACKIEIYAYYEGSWHFKSGMGLNGPTWNFNEYDLDTYKYFASWWDNDDQPHIERFMIKVIDTSVSGKKCAITEYINIDNVRILVDDVIGSGYEQPGN